MGCFDIPGERRGRSPTMLGWTPLPTGASQGAGRRLSETNSEESNVSSSGWLTIQTMFGRSRDNMRCRQCSFSFESVAQAQTKCVGIKIAFHFAVMREGDCASLFRNNDSYGVGFLCNPDSSSMPRSKFFAQSRLHGERKETCGCGNASILHNHRSIMERNGGIGQRHQSSVRKGANHRKAPLNISFQANVAFDYDQCACLVRCQRRYCQNDFVIELVSMNAGKARKQRRLAKPREGAPDFVLEYDDDRDNKIRQNIGQ